jgi:2-iminobutanoate/2-iminopropanoate deaminase
MFTHSLAATLVGLCLSGTLFAADAPAVPGAPYSPGVMADGTFYVSGHLGMDPASQKIPADADMEAHLVLDAVKQTLTNAGLSMDDLVSVTVYCTDLSLYDRFNTVYRSYFHDRFPARAFIGINQLVRGAHFEVAGIAVKSRASAR